MKRISFVTIIVILAFIIIRLSTSIYSLWHKQDVLTSAEKQLSQEIEENNTLKKEYLKVKSPSFIDEEARNRLLLVKPGEAQVLIDQNLLSASKSATLAETSKPFWQQWLDLFGF